MNVEATECFVNGIEAIAQAVARQFKWSLQNPKYYVNVISDDSNGRVETENFVNEISETDYALELSPDAAVPAGTDTHNKVNLCYTLDNQHVIVTVDFLGVYWSIDLTCKDYEQDYCLI